MDKMDKMTCQLCGRIGVETTAHHLVPKETGGRDGEIIRLCLPCHRQIHALYSNRELAMRLNTLNKLKNDERIVRYLRWIKNQDPGEEITIKKARSRKLYR